MLVFGWVCWVLVREGIGGRLSGSNGLGQNRGMVIMHGVSDTPKAMVRHANYSGPARNGEDGGKSGGGREGLGRSIVGVVRVVCLESEVFSSLDLLISLSFPIHSRWFCTDIWA